MRLLKDTFIKNIRRLLQIVLIILGINSAEFGNIKEVSCIAAIGIVYIPVMVALNSPNIRTILIFRYRILTFFKTIIKEYKKYSVIGWRVLTEELVWRCSFVFLMNYFGIDNISIVLVGSILFYLIHAGFSKKIVVISELELIQFIFILYISFIITDSLAGVWILHFYRNGYLTFINGHYSG